MITLKFKKTTMYGTMDMFAYVESFANELRNMGAMVCEHEDLNEWWVEVHNTSVRDFINNLNKRVKQVQEIETLPVGEDVWDATKFYETEENMFFSAIAYETWIQWCCITL